MQIILPPPPLPPLELHGFLKSKCVAYLFQKNISDCNFSNITPSLAA